MTFAHSRAPRSRTLLVVAAALGASLVLAPAALAAPDKPTVEYVLTVNNGNPEGVAWDPESQTFFTGTTSNGTIYRGTLGDTSVDVWIEGPGTPAIGMKVDDGLLYVAGGPSGLIKVYDIATATLVGTFDTGTGGFLNDLVATNRGVFVTDSLRPILWHITPEMLEAGSGTPDAVAVGPEIPYTGGFALNGIVAFKGGQELIVVHSALGNLYRIDLSFAGGEVDERAILEIDSPAVNGDGLLVDQGMLIAVIGGAAQLHFLDLSPDHSSATFLFSRTDPTFQRPSTIARAKNTYLVVNADFTTNTPPFTLSGLPRQ
jgi:sugar lactone lactonase YvrE